MAKEAKTKKDETRKRSTEAGKFLSLDMSFDKAMKLAANTPKPKKKAKK
jgi:hypothetical protein